MSKKQRLNAGAADEARRLQQVRAQLAATSRANKQSIATTLQVLHDNGLLVNETMGGPRERHKIRTAVEHHARAMTPYGCVVQQVGVPLVDGTTFAWDIINSFAFMYYLTSLCVPFARIMHDSLRAAGGQLQLVLYGDELTPGNVLRPDKGRQALCFYYTFIQWPTWLLPFKDGWLALGALQTKTLAKVDGGCSALVAIILQLFFTLASANFTTGFFVNYWP
jgi:hypothetical protein